MSADDRDRDVPIGDYRHLEVLAWTCALCVFALGVLLIGFGFVWLMGVVRAWM